MPLYSRRFVRGKLGPMRAPAEDVFGLVGHEIEQLRFERVVEQGGFGIVYRAWHVGLGVPVAVKCLRIQMPVDPALGAQFRDRFRDEIKIAYHLSQGNDDIARSLLGGTLRSPRTQALVPYMVMEWLEGHTLAEELEARRGRGASGMPLAEAIHVLDPAVRAIAYAHSRGVWHRDVKPANLFLTATPRGSRLKVLDFGLAKAADAETIGTSGIETAQGLFLCSPSYAAPEQLDRRFGEIGARTDVYSLALVILEVLSGAKVRRVRTAAEALLLVAHPQATEVTPASVGLDLPPPIDAALRRALLRDTRARQADASELWREITEGMGAVQRARSVRPAPAAPARRPLLWIAFALLLVLTFGGGVATAWLVR